MSVESHRVLMGACGWKHQAWLNDFYSDDLPEDWQLGFYSNEFSVVYVPLSDWIDEEDLSVWADEVSETFRFILEVPADILSDTQRFATALTKAKELDELCLGLIFKVNEHVTDNIQLFKQHLEQALEFVPVCVDNNSAALSSEIKNILVEKNISEVWHGDSSDIESLKRGALAVSHVNANEIEMAALRKIVEGCLSASTEKCISVLCLDGDPPSLEKLRNAEIILNLL